MHSNAGQVNQKLTSDILDTFLASRRQGMSNHTLLFYQRYLSKAIGIELYQKANGKS